MKFYLRDRNQVMVDKWKIFFGDNPDFEITCGDIFAGPTADALVSPANSAGFMDGGIDYVYTQKFGKQLQDRLMKLIQDFHYGELPVGQAVIIETILNDPNVDIPYLISAPTMRTPTVVKGSVNAYLAFRAALIAIKEWNRDNWMGVSKKINSVICPGLGIGIGQIDPFACAKQMHEAYKAIWLDQPIKPKNCAELFYHHQELLGWPPASLKVDNEDIHSPKRKGE